AIAAIIERRDEILKVRAALRAERERLAQRDRELDRELADCRAAARLFGAKIEFPETDATATLLQLRSLAHAHQTTPAEAFEEFRKKINATGVQGVTVRTAKDALAEAIAIPKSPMPRVADIVLDRLKAAGAKGTRASRIQGYIQNTYNAKIHDK